jgi:MinD-like ATPase involved in chromosome partitioning or flagellar assembly/tetratricopeptide (TPR) repeat protein
MSMFITFYSFKGGVGRTLALANVATLLARDRNEPCRVLVWDFDLAAPGLQDVMECKWKGDRLGFVDYLHSYLRDAKVCDIGDYIYKTAVPGVDILPAGFMGREYAQKLDGIQWQEIYEEARGFQFISNTKTQISQLKPSYDYVLIDSLTGYSDVGGICVNQIADAVVLIFRLNSQNIDGVSKVYRSIKTSAKNGILTSQSRNVTPVISPAWPFAASETNEWYLKAKKVFGNRRIFTLSFEGSMMLGEKILSAGDESYNIEPPILRDYRVLTQHLRSLNSQDLQTTYKLAEKLQEQDRFSTATELFGNLVERRPNVERYWRELTTTVQIAPTGANKKILSQAKEIILRGCDLRRPWAYVAKAWLAETVENNWKAAYEDFGRAIELDRDNPYLYFYRGFSQVNHEEYSGAVQDFLRALELNLGGPRLSFAYVHLANSYQALGQPKKALPYFSKAIKMLPNDDVILFWRAITLYSMGRYAEAAADLDRASNIDPFDEHIRIERAHLAAALGEPDEAMQLLNAVRQRSDLKPSQLLTLAEAYLVVAPSETISLLDANPDAVKELRTIASFLKAFAATLLGMDEVLADSVAILHESGSSLREEGWYITELKEFLKWGKARARLNESQCVTLSKLLSDSGWAEEAQAQEAGDPESSRNLQDAV